jgi:hypothetical protein
MARLEPYENCCSLQDVARVAADRVQSGNQQLPCALSKVLAGLRTTITET